MINDKELTPEENQALNEAAKLTCAWETTWQTGEE